MTTMPLTPSRSVLRWLEYLAYPAAAGAAFVILSLGVVTWLPAAAAMAYTLQRWRVDGDPRCFVGVFRAWPLYWRTLLPHSIVSTMALALVALDIAFLLSRSQPAALLVLALQVGILAAFAVYHLALVVVAAQWPPQSIAGWCRGAVVFGFGSVNRGTALLGSAIASAILSVVVPLGPLLLGSSIPVVIALSIYEKECSYDEISQSGARGGDHGRHVDRRASGPRRIGS